MKSSSSFFRSRKAAYFFVLDAFIAGIIVVSTISILFGATIMPEDPRQNYLLAEDFMSYLETTNLLSFPSEVRFELQQEGIITDLSRSLLETAVFLYAEDVDSYEEYDSENPVTRLLNEVALRSPEQIGVAFYIQGAQEDEDEPTLLFSTVDSQGTPNDVRVMLVTQRIVLDDTLEPYFVEVRMWR